MDTNVIIALVAGLASVAGAFVAYRASSQANLVNKQKVDSEAFDRSQQMYERMLSTQDKELTRLQGQVDRLNSHLDRTNEAVAREKDISETLRALVIALQRQVGVMEETIANMRAQLDTENRPTRGRRSEYLTPGPGRVENPRPG